MANNASPAGESVIPERCDHGVRFEDRCFACDREGLAMSTTPAQSPSLSDHEDREVEAALYGTDLCARAHREASNLATARQLEDAAAIIRSLKAKCDALAAGVASLRKAIVTAESIVGDLEGVSVTYYLRQGACYEALAVFEAAIAGSGV